MTVRFVAIVNARNELIYFRAKDGVSDAGRVNYQFIAEMSLDFLEQAAPQMHQQLTQPAMVMLHEGIAVYVLLSCTRTKYIVGMDSINDDYDITKIINALADTYVGYQCNPFGNKEGRVESPAFDLRVRDIIS